jgi:hypothetical protein
VGVYVYAAAFSLLMAIVTLIGWQFDSPEVVIIHRAGDCCFGSESGAKLCR